ncbi:MAG TPA: hypothetical protein VFF52_22645 [Isosphaeraceae bacterium]|nr:hypothetical protein [Isosphaeraceae bacterium]
MAQTLLRIASRARLLRGIDGRFYASVPEGDRAECHELRSSRFGRWLTRAYRQEGNQILYPDLIRRVVGLLEAEAEQAGALETAYLRVGGGDTGSTGRSTYYLDLGDRSRRAIAIGPGCWRLVDRPSVHFRRPDGFAALPTPSRDGSVDLLRKYTNITDAEFPLLVAWLTAALRPVGPYPVLNLVGEQGSAKSTLARVARLLIDPHASPLRAEPESRRDLMVGALNNWLLAFDNLSALPSWLSDGLCRLATGGAFAARKLYDDDQEHHFSAQRPVILNGISELPRRGDLIDRSLFLNLPPIPNSQRQYEEDLWAAFQADAPRLLGGLLDAVAGGLRLLPEIQLASRPRMADFARWGEAVAQARGQAPGTFLQAYLLNRCLASMTAVDDSPVARGVIELVARLGSWTGPASELLVLLRELIRDPLADAKRWPKSPIWLSEQLRRAAPQLRTCGVIVTFLRRRAGREIRIERDKLTVTAPS